MLKLRLKLRFQLIIFWITIAVIIIDQATKYLAREVLNPNYPLGVFPGFNLTLTENTGAAFSLFYDAGGWQRWVLGGISLIVSICIFVWVLRLPSEKRWLRTGLCLLLGGALSNMWDRLVIGHVTDFLDVYIRTWHWPVFNIADSAICAGAIMLAIDLLRHPNK